jgi:mono/diheme cytochrome c family protein
MKWYIALGTVGIIVIMALLGYVGLGEQERMASFSRSYQSRQIEVGAFLYENNCRSCHGPQGKGIDGVAPSINTAEIFNGQRLEAIGFNGTVEDYLGGVIAAGRPIPSEGANYPLRMPTWGQRFGGPMRDDQIESLVWFIMNWEDRALAGDSPAPPSIGDVVGTDIFISLPEGDIEAGRSLSAGAAGCAGCHELSAVGPPWAPQEDLPGIGERVEMLVESGDYSGQATSVEQYLVESVIAPNNFIFEGYDANIMPGNYGDRLTVQELADMVAYMLSLR